VNATRRKDGRAPLHWAARNGRLETCAWLVSRGADANAATYDGDTPFNLAVWRGHDDVARFFVSLGGVDPRRTNRWGCNALLWACIRTREDAPSRGDVENERGDGRGATRSVLATVRWLVDELDVPVDVVNVNGHSAIHKCAIYGHGDVIDWLIDRDDARVAAGDPKRPALLDAAHFAPDDRNSAPSDLAMTNGHVALSATLRRLEDRRSRVPAVYDGGETRA
jgi:ankyrin repeat protein